MQYRRFVSDDIALLNAFRCARRKDPPWQRLIQRMLRQDLLPALNDQSRDIFTWVAITPTGQLAGLATVERVESDVGAEYELTCLGVSLDHRRQKVGSTLAMHAMAGVDAAQCLVYVDYRNNSMRSLIKNLRGERTDCDQSWELDVYEFVPRALKQELERSDPSPQRLHQPRAVLFER